MTKLLSSTGTSPVTWNKGTLTRVRGGLGGGVPFDSRMPSIVTGRSCRRRSAVVTARWVDSAPLASPVEPEVKRMVASSSGATSGSDGIVRGAAKQGRERVIEMQVDRQR